MLLIEDHLRAALMKICVCDTSLKSNPPGIKSYTLILIPLISLIPLIPVDCTFMVYIHTNRVAAASIEYQHMEKVLYIAQHSSSLSLSCSLTLVSMQGFSWIIADSAVSEPLPDVTTVPLKSISSSFIQVTVFFVLNG